MKSEVESVNWSCQQGGAGCSENFGNSSFLNQMMIFTTEGSYELQSEVTINGVKKSSTTLIEVDKRVIPHVQIKYFPPQPIDVLKANEIVVTVLNLIPKCFTFWNIVVEEGFSGFRQDAEGNLTDMGFSFIKDTDEFFLHELVDYDNSTLSKDSALNIPPDVLTPHQKHKFRLTITCPEPLTDSEPATQRQNVTSFFDVIVDTNGPPETLPLLVQPSSGIAMRQKFKFSTGEAKDSASDFPLKYSFGYIVDNVTVVIGTFYDNTVAHTQLPSSDSIETFFEVCDNSKACSRVWGPIVAVDASQNYTNEEIEFKIAEFEAMLGRAEYSNAMNSGLVFLMTQKRISDDASSYEDRMLKMMKSSLEKLKSTDTESFFHKQNIIEYVKMLKNLMAVMTIADEQFVDEVLTLTETIDRSSRKMKRMIATAERVSKVVNHDTDYIKTVLSFSEILLASNNASVVQKEKRNLVSNIHRFSASLCQDKNLNLHVIESKFATIEVSKVFSPQLSIDPQWLPGGDGSVLLAFNSNFPPKYVCVAKVKYLMDVFTPDSNVEPTEVNEMLIMDNDSSGIYKPIPISDLSESVMIEISAPSNDEANSCVMRKADSWTSDDCTKQKTTAADRVACKCKTNGISSIVVK